MAEFDFCHIFSLGLINAESNHEVRDDLGLLLGLTDDFDGLVNVEENFFQTLQEVKTLLGFLEVKIDSAADTFGPEGDPLLEKFLDSKDPGTSRNEDVEIAGE